VVFSFFCEDVDFPEFDQLAVLSVFDLIISDHGKTVDYINIVFCSDEYLLQVNKDYLQHDYYTDIITFDYSDQTISSDVFISIDRIADNAKAYKIPFLHELYRILFHGVLHLVGYEDKTPDVKKIMTEKEDYYLSKTRF